VRGAIRRISLTVLGVLLLILVGPAPASFAEAAPHVYVFTIQGADLDDLMATPGFLGLAQGGGAALWVMSDPGDPLFELRHAFGRVRGGLPGILPIDIGCVAGTGEASQRRLNEATRQIAKSLRFLNDDALVFIVSSPLPDCTGAHTQLGALVMAEGVGSELAAAMANPSATVAGSLTSDSSRRHGVVTSADMAHTAIATAGTSSETLRDPGGAEIRVVGGPPPLDLYDRYVQSKRLTVPIGTAAAVYAVLASLVAIASLFRSGASPRSRTAGSSLAISVPFLALSLLLAGHLPSLTYATVVPFLVATTVIGTLALAPAARRWGTLGGVAAAGVILLGALTVEAALGWPAALTPLLGGSQLDGGRFFGLPNAFIGLLLGGSLYVAQRLPRSYGTALIAVAGLFAGSPWTGSNIGAAVTLFAAGGIWWGLRGGLTWWRTAIAAVAAIAAGTLLVVVAHRYLTSAATHITTFSEHTGGIGGMWHKLVDRLGVGADLIAQNPFALLPVIGVLGMLLVVLRPPGPVRASFQQAPVWRLALLTIVAASVVAYLVNDSGAAAVGEGLTTSLGGMLYVSLRWRDGMMMTS
jgi:hypothetical protein